jgi:hypothetical protein
MTDLFTDGNALAGPLDEIFTVEMTMARGQCAGCGRTGTVAEMRVYGMSPGMVARCPGCDEVLMRLVRTPDRAFLDLRGVVALEIPMPPDGGR